MGLEMEELATVLPMEAAASAAREQGVEIYPLSRYYFGAKDAPRAVETPADRALRLKANFAAHGLRTSVHGVLLVLPAFFSISAVQFPTVELFDHPHVLLLQVRNSSFVLPGGRLRPGEEDVQGLKRKLSSKLSVVSDGEGATGDVDDWQVGECIGMWWRSEFGAVPFPYMPPSFRTPKCLNSLCCFKECIKLFLIRLPMSRRFVVPRNMKLLAVPLSQIHGNAQVYGPIISGIPNLLSKFSFNVITD
ncbi:hypothetical protein PR202_gb03358 [Eleusine coracana subsp. coracana]|uniref:Pre-mRNA cleavage factor Im 25 kDa subunit n=1 Tax=Eleusine coracana subsp. coracana TaxID=191504 RepID=A0AAV5E2M5_ELECO|nr:hypothetical protein PR202_gb03358 [Eleusine coracana subsp. coracana]